MGLNEVGMRVKGYAVGPRMPSDDIDQSEAMISNESKSNGSTRNLRTTCFPNVSTERELACLAYDLSGFAAAKENSSFNHISIQDADLVKQVKSEIAAGGDPLGDTFCKLRPQEIRRQSGAIYTPQTIVSAMIAWAREQGNPERIVDPGAGSGAFLTSAAKAFPNAELVAIELDPLAAQILRANAAVLGFSDRLNLHLQDYRSFELPTIKGQTLFIGNPPYVRHHEIGEVWKDWLRKTAERYGLRASALAGLHVHFLLKTRELARNGDYGSFITSSEWLDTNYGQICRKLLANELGCSAIHVLEPKSMPFGETASTGAISCFKVGRTEETIRMRSVSNVQNLGNLSAGFGVSRARLSNAERWSPLLHRSRTRRKGMIELGEVFRVHRGEVTGCNAVWVADEDSNQLPSEMLVPAVTKAKELFAAGSALTSTSNLRRVVALPGSLEELDSESRAQVQDFLHWAAKRGADKTYTARHRRPWWRIPLRTPAPILCTYMARRPPAFVRNYCGAHHLNIAHGLYPRELLSDQLLDSLASWLQTNVLLASGRTYAGGLTKFEPREVEKLLIPAPELT